MFIALPNAVLHAIETLNTAGYEAYAVGGCVRDSLMGKTPGDWDITTSATPAEMQQVFADYRCIETGLQHGTLTVLMEDMPLEITTYRVDGHYSDGRHPDAVTFTRALAEDLRRRDFTINAMAYHPTSGLVDLYGGQTDVKNGVIRCVGDPQQRFREDALRILRALRFSSVLGFAIAPDTAVALEVLSPTLHRVSIERIAVELQRLLCGKQVAITLSTYRKTLSLLLPNLECCADYSLLNRVRAVAHVRFAALFHLINVSAQEAETVLRALRLDNQTIRSVTLLLCDQHHADVTQTSGLLRLLNRLGTERIYDYLMIHDADEAIIRHVDHLIESNACYCLSMLVVSGDDVIKAGIAAGPEVGRILQRLLDAVIDGICPNCREALLNYLFETKKPVQ